MKSKIIIDPIYTLVHYKTGTAMDKFISINMTTEIKWGHSLRNTIYQHWCEKHIMWMSTVTFLLSQWHSDLNVLSALPDGPIISIWAAGQRWLSHHLPHKIPPLGTSSCQREEVSEGRGGQPNLVSMSMVDHSSGPYKNKQQARFGWVAIVCQPLTENMYSNLLKMKVEDLLYLPDFKTYLNTVWYWQKHQRINKWNWIEKYSHTYKVISSLTKAPKQSTEESVFNKWSWKTIQIHGTIWTLTSIIPYTKTNLRSIIDVNIKAKAFKASKIKWGNSHVWEQAETS